MKPLIKKLAIGLAVVVVLFVAAIVLAVSLIDLDGMINAELAKQKPELEKKLGRSVDTGRLKTTIFPTLGGRLEQVSIGSDPAHAEDDEPLMQVGAVGFEVALWDAILSGGKRVTIKSIYLDDLRVSVVRYKGGKLSYEDVVQRQANSSEPKPAEEQNQVEGEAKFDLNDLRIDEIRIADARFRLVDLDTPTGERAESTIQKFNLKIRDVRAGKPIAVHMDAAIFSDVKNFELATSVGPIALGKSSGAEGEAVKIHYVTLEMDKVDLSKLAPYLGTGGPRLTSTLASADWKVSEIIPGKPIEMAGFFELENVQVGEGKPFDARLDTALEVLADGKGIDIEKLEFAIGQAKLSASGSLRDLATKPSFKDLKIRSSGLNPDALLAHFPEARADLPKGTRLKGDIAIDVTATGDADRQTVLALVDFTPVDILYPGSLRKPAGTPMKLSMDGEFTASEANLRRAGFVLDELDLAVSGTVKNFAEPTFNLKASAPPFSIDRLARLLPSLHEQLESTKTTASGKGAISGKLQGTATNLDGALEVALKGVKLEVPDTHVEGDLVLTAAAKGNPSGDFLATANFNADAAVIRMDGTLDKKAGTPLSFVADLKGTSARWELRKFDLRLAEMRASASGTVQRETSEVAIDAKLDPLDLEKLSKTVLSLPAKYVKKSNVSFKAKVTGSAETTSLLEVAVTDFKAQLGRSDLRGTLTVKGLDTPEVKLQLASNFLDVDELYPPEPDAAGGEGGGGKEAPEADDPQLKDYSVAGEFTAKRMLYRKDELTNVRCSLQMREGLVKLDACSLNVYGGTVTATGSSAEIWRGKMPYTAVLDIKDVELDRALSSKTKYGGLIQGRTQMQVNLRGRGFETEDLEQYLTGDLGLGMAEGRLLKAQLTESVAGKVATLGKVSTAQKLATAGMLKDLAATFTVKDGKFTLVKPIETSVDGNALTLDGAIGVGGGVFLDGTYFLSAKSFGEATQGRCSGEGELAIPLKIQGAARSPSYALDTAALGKEVASRCLSGAIGSALKDKLGIDVPTSGAGVAAEAARQRAELEAKARGEMEAKKAQAAAAVKAEQDRARAEAERRAAEQKRKAEEAAKKKAGDALRGVFGK